MAEPFFSLTQWTLSWGQKKIGTSWLVFTQLLISIVVTAVRSWGGSTKELMRHHRSTRKGNSYLKSQKLWRIIGSLLEKPYTIHPIVDASMPCFLMLIFSRNSHSNGNLSLSPLFTISMWFVWKFVELIVLLLIQLCHRLCSLIPYLRGLCSL